MSKIIAVRKLSTSGVTIESLAPNIQEFIKQQVKICQPDKVYVCDGTEEERQAIMKQLEEDGRVVKLPKYDNW